MWRMWFDEESVGTARRNAVAVWQRQGTPHQGWRDRLGFTTLVRAILRTPMRGFKVEQMVSANGNKPISSLSDAAEPHCVLVKDYSWGGGRSETARQRAGPVLCPSTLENSPSRRLQEA